MDHYDETINMNKNKNKNKNNNNTNNNNNHHHRRDALTNQAATRPGCFLLLGSEQTSGISLNSTMGNMGTMGSQFFCQPDISSNRGNIKNQHHQHHQHQHQHHHSAAFPSAQAPSPSSVVAGVQVHVERQQQRQGSSATATATATATTTTTTTTTREIRAQQEKEKQILACGKSTKRMLSKNNMPAGNNVYDDKDAWLLHFKALIDFREKFGHTRVPKRYKADQKLASWVLWHRTERLKKKQILTNRRIIDERSNHTNTNTNTDTNVILLTDDREFALDQIGFEWDPYFTTTTTDTTTGIRKPDCPPKDGLFSLPSSLIKPDSKISLGHSNYSKMVQRSQQPLPPPLPLPLPLPHQHQHQHQPKRKRDVSNNSNGIRKPYFPPKDGLFSSPSSLINPDSKISLGHFNYSKTTPEQKKKKKEHLLGNTSSTVTQCKQTPIDSSISSRSTSTSTSTSSSTYNGYVLPQQCTPIPTGGQFPGVTPAPTSTSNNDFAFVPVPICSSTPTLSDTNSTSKEEEHQHQHQHQHQHHVIINQHRHHQEQEDFGREEQFWNPNLNLWEKRKEKKEMPCESSSLEDDHIRGSIHRRGHEQEVVEALSPGEKWESLMEELVQFRLKNGHFNVTTAENSQLASWVRSHQLHKKLKEEGTLVNKGMFMEERERRLTEIGFTWDWDTAEAEAAAAASTQDIKKQDTTTTYSYWNERFEELRVFLVQNGHVDVCRSNSNSSSEQHILGDWVHSQRLAYEQKILESERNCLLLTDEQEAKLNVLGMNWKLEDEEVPSSDED